jgi:hypothetical protein
MTLSLTMLRCPERVSSEPRQIDGGEPLIDRARDSERRLPHDIGRFRPSSSIRTPAQTLASPNYALVMLKTTRAIFEQYVDWFRSVPFHSGFAISR